MATLSETAEWVAGIYQLETTDLVMGGADGVDNVQAMQLAKRTRFLKGEIDELRALLVQEDGHLRVTPPGGGDTWVDIAAGGVSVHAETFTLAGSHPTLAFTGASDSYVALALRSESGGETALELGHGNAAMYLRMTEMVAPSGFALRDAVSPPAADAAAPTTGYVHWSHATRPTWKTSTGTIGLLGLYSTGGAATATAGSRSLPSGCEGFMLIELGGVLKKVAYYGE